MAGTGWTMVHTNVGIMVQPSNFGAALDLGAHAISLGAFADIDRTEPERLAGTRLSHENKGQPNGHA